MNLKFRSIQDLQDLSGYLTRAKRLDEAGLVKLKAFENILGIYVSPIFSGNLLDAGPTVIGLRTLELAGPNDVDSSFEIAAILERIANAGEDLQLSLPAVTARAAWTGVTPPRTDWELADTISQEQVTQWAKNGIGEVGSSLPDSIGSAIALKVRSSIWGKPVGASQLFPAGCAFVMMGLGFMTEGETVSVYRARGWVRLSTQNGHVLARAS